MHAPHPLHGTRLASGRLYTCSDCGAEFAGTHKQAVVDSEVTARYCRDCRPVGFDAPDTRLTAADVRQDSTPRSTPDTTPTTGSAFNPRYLDGEPAPISEFDAHRQAEVRQRVIDNRINTKGSGR